MVIFSKKEILSNLLFDLSDKTIELPRLVRFAHSHTAARREMGVFSGHFRAPCTNSA